MAKNAGKTECLNYILRRVKNTGKRFALTSIGIDGESRDQVCQTPKPEIEVFEDMIFITSEMHYRDKRLVAEIMDVSTQQTSLGRLVTARAVSSGKVLLSGPADTGSLRTLIHDMKRWDVDTTIVDGALSRLSLSSPAVTEAMVLATGAALSCNIPQLVRKTKYVYDLICLNEAAPDIVRKLMAIEQGVWSIDDEGNIYDLDIPSVFMLENKKDDIFKHGNTLYVAGAISDKLLQFLRQQKQIREITLIMRDFTKMFASMETYYAFVKKGGTIQVLQKSKLLAVCINPQSPDGYCLDSDELRVAMQTSLGIPVYDVKRIENNSQSKI
ncbi:hypothetical protein H8S64_16535 [Butyricimonas sp. NSJ-56]|uniref:Uncharacterized protein n=1 Tax=Butyricimonas hominis TaxID=2763032 RepID=A0ABR7D420_9BACT|nr:hypothetical protein [Butyricimonas hominis]MBC5622701.1 hypothetical protein [Butyricimonas hominis]